ncbi:MAG: TlpA family protein disulfide reductase [Chloroflexota bacterium]|nr:TlpA family protein disulfide reductase [Chloroflexota bacterium]
MALPQTSSTESTGTSPPSARRRTSVVLALVVTLVLISGAWAIGDHQSFSQIGTGGTNLKLLPSVGEPAPDFVTLRADNGQPVSLAGFRGQPVWLNFWGSWCPPCRSEFPEMQAAYAEVLQPNGVALLAISLDESPAAAMAFARRNDGTFPILSDPDRSDTGAGYPIANFPTHILIDREGIVRDVILSPIDREEIIARADTIITTRRNSP